MHKLHSAGGQGWIQDFCVERGTLEKIGKNYVRGRRSRRKLMIFFYVFRWGTHLYIQLFPFVRSYIRSLVPSLGQNVPNLGQHVPSLRQLVPRTGKLVPSTGQLVPTSGQHLTMSGQLVPNLGQSVPNLGQSVPTFRTSCPKFWTN